MKKIILVLMAAVIFLFIAGCKNLKTDSEIVSSNITDTVTTESTAEPGLSAKSDNSVVTAPTGSEVDELSGSVCGAKVNGALQNLDYVLPGSIYLSTVDRSATSVTIDLVFSDNTAYVKDISNNTDLRPGINKVTLTIANKETEAKIVWLIYSENLDSNCTIAMNTYSSAMDFYWGEDELTFDNNIIYSQDGWNDLPLCTNFAEVSSKLFTTDGLQQFISYNNYHTYSYKDNNYYFLSPQRGGNITYIGTILIPKTPSDDRLIYTAQSYYRGDAEYTSSNYTVKDEDFMLVKQNGQWLVDNFKLPD